MKDVNNSLLSLSDTFQILFCFKSKTVMLRLISELVGLVHG